MINKPKPAAFEKWRQKNVSALDLAMSRFLEKQALGQGPEISALIDAMGYALLSGGKRLRPLLALASAEAVGGRAQNAFPAAIAVEMIHCYSLIHDDLPAMDDDDLRRGRPSCHKVFGESLAILAGDALLTLAFEAIFSGAANSDPLRRSQAALRLARSAGVLGMVGGQAMDLAFEAQAGEVKNKTGEAMVRDMETRKTGELISASMTCGAILGGATAAQIKSLGAMGLSLGLAFQIQDDLLNIHGNAKLLGKAVGSDQERGKATLPEIAGEDAARTLLNKLTHKCLLTAEKFGRHGQRLADLIESLIHRQS